MDFDTLFIILKAWRDVETTGKASFPVFLTFGAQRITVTVNATKDAKGALSFTFAFSL